MPRTAAPMAQLNIRMNATLKARGDAVLERADITATQLIRAVWAKVACGRESLDQLIRVLAADTRSSAQANETQPGDAVVARIRNRQDSLERAFGLDPTTYVSLSEEEMRDLLYEERLGREREWLAQND